ncbi:hypothetical protein L7F22_013541 [Adiantum nelumboides]|nr:hypothetical protein [Adiantum nelumboides]
MKKRRPSTLNLSKKEQRDYKPLPLFLNMVEQAEEIVKTEEWRRMIHPSLRKNQGNPHSLVIQQITSTDFAIPKTAAKPSPSVVEKQLEKERQDMYCAEGHQLKAIQAMFSALEQYLIDKAVMSKIAKEPVSEWKLQRPVKTCQDTGAALSYLNQELVPPHLRQKLRHGIPVSYANNSRGQINQTVQCQIALTNLKALVTLYLHPHPNTDLTIGSDVISKLTPWAIQLTAFDYLRNGVTVLTKEQVAEKELKYSEPYILPPANAKPQPMESALNWHTNALKEIAELQYNIISRIDAMVKAKQSATPSTSDAAPSTASQQLVPLNYNTSASSSILPRMFWALQSSAILPDNFPQSKSPFIADDLEDAFNPSLRWGNLAKNLSAPHHRYTCGEMVCQLSNPEDYLWQGFMDDANSEPKVINEHDEVKRLNPVKMETDDVKDEEPSTSASTSSTSLKGVSKTGDMTIIDIDGLNQEQRPRAKISDVQQQSRSALAKSRTVETIMKEGYIAPECLKRKKRFGNAVLPEKYEYEVEYCNRFEKHDIPISKYMQYEFEEDETFDSTSFESLTVAVSSFSDDTSSVMFNMVQKPYAFLKRAKVRVESSSSSSPTTTSGSEESEPSWMKKGRPSTLNLSKKEQRDYIPLPLFSNMVEQANKIVKTEEWRRMIHPGLRKNQGSPPSPVIQQTASTDFAIPKTAAKPSPSVVEKQLEKERQDRYCTEEHQLKAIQAMFSALE